MPSLHIHDWDIHQTYRKDRGQPLWIKVQRTVMRNLKWISLDDAERGQLVSIWLLAADNNGFIPDDATLIQKLCFMSPTPNLKKFIDLGFVDKDDVNMTSSGCHDGVNVASARRQGDVPEAEAEAETETEGADTPKPAPNDPKETFQSFWEAYPRKVGKANAQTAWMKLKPDKDLLATILAALAKQKKLVGWQEDDGKWIPHPSTWLNGKRWQDEIKPKGKKSQTSEPFLGIAGLI